MVPNNTLSDTIKRYVVLGNCFAKSTQQCPTLASYLHIKKEIYDVLKKQWEASQPLYGNCIQALIIALITLREPHLLQESTRLVSKLVLIGQGHLSKRS
jgi:hypothetical protein